KPLCTACRKLPFDRPDHRANISEFNNIIVHLDMYAFPRRIEWRVRRQNNHYRIGICPSHGVHYLKSIRLSVDVEITDENIKLIRLDRLKRFGNVRGNVNLKAVFLKQRRQGQADTRFIVYEKQASTNFSLRRSRCARLS